MGLRIGALIVDCRDPGRLARFWAKALDRGHPRRCGPGRLRLGGADPEGNEFCLLRTRLKPL
ncbi:hypothetical protein E1267_39230 [Nonomuraea longispora]|uniref:Glyoxalase-like domain-containing protein n=1 Tax=Nonomuraea longispora TaxID=1848320 RepID=A0A4R4MUM3_9ACTN|nr:hypothetical protein [Nonomuraea longispora]TDB97979.1 hypothetical protein E1267_39230 [Nonomuraea longispora]